MRIIKYGTPRQTLNIVCKACGCEFELGDEEMRYNMGQEEVKTQCPCCGGYIFKSRNEIVVHNGCISYCMRCNCEGCEWEI